MPLDKQTAALGAAALAIGGHMAYPFWFRDIREIRKMKSLRETVERHLDAKIFTVDLFERAVDRTPYKPFIIYEDTVYSYSDIETKANQLASFAQRHGLKVGDTVALLMRNGPDFVWASLGFAKLGIKCALINCNLRSDSLLHSLVVSQTKVLLVGTGIDLLEIVDSIGVKINDNQFDIWSIGHNSTPTSVTAIDDQLLTSENMRPPAQLRSAINGDDPVAYIFTSGTTGLPKATQYPHVRALRAAYRLVSSVGTSDVVLINTPLYHAVGYTTALGSIMRAGATCVLTQKFSVREFWPLCCRHRVTVFYYVGELCRFLLAAPQRPEDTMHNVRCIIGNGLQADIWSKFLERFQIPKIVEFYGASDNAVFTINEEIDKVAAVGCVSPLIKKYIGFELVKFCFDKAEPIRNASGLCIPVKVGEPGLLLSPVIAENNVYLGNEEANEKRLLRHVFKAGDVYINTGDLMMFNKDYYLYFVDRLGDTFRWRGENVATTEVSQVIGSYPDVKQVIVYGVKVPGHNGRAGMAAIVCGDDDRHIDLRQLYAHLQSRLPSYAVPRFLRIREALETTVTFKYTKTDLMKEGFDPTVIKEAVFMYDDSKQTYCRVDEDVYGKLVRGMSRL